MKHFQYKDKNIKRIGKDILEQKTKTKVVTLISDKLDFRTKNIIRDKERHFTISSFIHQ